jgi:Secretion system C-terminal sorting domain
MKSSILVLFFISFLTPSILFAQSDIEGVVVEKYYISDQTDSEDEDGGFSLPQGSITYRIFLDLAEGSKLRSFFSSPEHPLYITSTDTIWNNNDRGKTFGFEIDDNRLDENTVALDSWITFGLASDVHIGLLKTVDPDTSIVGGVNNDGGSNSVPEGLLTNADESAGIPITEKDGLLAMIDTIVPEIFVSGLHPETIFDDTPVDTSFYTTNTTILYGEGIGGIDSENRILVAQITTRGELTFELNVEIINSLGEVITYVANDEILLEGQFPSPFLKYPPECGCTDPEFLEYDPLAACDDGSCQTVVVIGCNDPAACNYDPLVNLNVPELCCILPDNCEGLDPELICENLDAEEILGNSSFSVYPNPFHDKLQFTYSGVSQDKISVTVHNMLGEVCTTNFFSGNEWTFDTSSLSSGMYYITIFTSNLKYAGVFVKN